MARTPNDDRSDAFNPTSSQYWANQANQGSGDDEDDNWRSYSSSPLTTPFTPLPLSRPEPQTAPRPEDVERDPTYEYCGFAINHGGYLIQARIDPVGPPHEIARLSELSLQNVQQKPYRITIWCRRTSFLPDIIRPGYCSFRKIPVSGVIWEFERFPKAPHAQSRDMLTQLKLAAAIVAATKRMDAYQIIRDGRVDIDAAAHVASRRSTIAAMKRELARIAGRPASSRYISDLLSNRIAIQRLDRYRWATEQWLRESPDDGQWENLHLGHTSKAEQAWWLPGAVAEREKLADQDIEPRELWRI